MHGGAFWRHRILFENGVNGKWVMEPQLIFGQINDLMGLATFSMLTGPNTLPDQSSVSLLIDSETGGWRDELVRQVFLLASV